MTLLFLGAICIIAAICNGTFEAAGARFPHLSPRQSVAVGVFGVLLMGGSLVAKADDSPDKSGQKPPSQAASGQNTAPASGRPGTPSAPSPVKVFWSGALRFPVQNEPSGYSFDVRPPRYIADKSVQYSWYGDDSLYVPSGSTMQVAEWTSDSTPTRDQCAATLTASGSEQTGGLSGGSQVCGTTSEGRTFLIKVDHTKTAYGLYTHVTVWSR